MIVLLIRPMASTFWTASSFEFILFDSYVSLHARSVRKRAVLVKLRQHKDGCSLVSFTVHTWLNYTIPKIAQHLDLLIPPCGLPQQTQKLSKPMPLYMCFDRRLRWHWKVWVPVGGFCENLMRMYLNQCKNNKPISVVMIKCTNCSMVCS